MYKHILPMILYYIVSDDILPYYIILCSIITFYIILDLILFFKNFIMKYIVYYFIVA